MTRIPNIALQLNRLGGNHTSYWPILSACHNASRHPDDAQPPRAAKSPKSGKHRRCRVKVRKPKFDQPFGAPVDFRTGQANRPKRLTEMGARGTRMDVQRSECRSVSNVNG